MKRVAIVGAGPAGLMAAQCLSAQGLAVQVFDAMPSVGRKFLLAGKGGLNLTHSEDLSHFATRYAPPAPWQEWLQTFGPAQVRAWASDLGIETFVGSSGRVFPRDMKAAPLLRAWLHRLRHPRPGGVPVEFHMRWRWDASVQLPNTAQGQVQLLGHTPHGPQTVAADAVLLALGGGSWPRLGSDGGWVAGLRARGVEVAPLQPANCGFDVAPPWSEAFASRFAGVPLKSVALGWVDGQGVMQGRKGECVVTATGIEGSLVYAASSALRHTLQTQGVAQVVLDLLPDLSAERVLAEVAHPRGSRSLSSHLKSRLRLPPVKTALLHGALNKSQWKGDAQMVARYLKALPLTLSAPRPLAEAISSAGGVTDGALTADLMLKAWPGVFCAGEMLDWEAPTGGYLLTGCLSTAVQAAQGIVRYAAWTGHQPGVAL